MGWIRELGLRLLIDAINSSKIDLVYYLKSNTSNDLPDELGAGIEIFGLTNISNTVLQWSFYCKLREKAVKFVV